MPEPKFVYRAKLQKVIDGDTCDFLVDLGFSIWAIQRVRLLGIDAPETKGIEREKGIKTKDYVRVVLKDAKEIVIETVKDKKEKYGRYLATVYIDGKNLNKELLERGLARKWE